MPPPVPSTASANNQPGALSVWSLVLGILSLLCLGPLAGIPAVICGHMSRKRFANDGKSLAGLIMGYISIALLPVTLAMIVPAFAQAYKRASEVGCLSNLHQIAGAKDQFAVDNNMQPTSMVDLVPKYILVAPTCGKQGAYTIGGKDENPTCSVHGDLIENPPGSKRTPSRGQAEEAIEK